MTCASCSNVGKVFRLREHLAGRSAIPYGEVVRPGPDGRRMFYELMRRGGPFCF